MTTRIKLRRDTYQNWYNQNPTLALGEPAYDTTNNQVRIGDGTTAWRALDPLTAALGDLVVSGTTITSPEGVHQDLVLSTVDAGPNTRSWTFSLDGSLALPNGSSIESTSGNGIGLTTNRGTILFGNSPEPGGPTHFHIMKTDTENGSGGMDLYFGDDFNYVLQRPASYNGSPAYGVEIGANDKDGGSQHVWRFGTDGNLTLPGGGFIGWDNTSTSPAFNGTMIGAALGDDFNIQTIGGLWKFGEDGTTTFPGGHLKIVPNGANPYISNRTDNGLGLVSGSAVQIRQSTADAYGITIDSSTTDTSLGEGHLLAIGSAIDVNGTGIVLGKYTVNNIDANTGLSLQNKVEINNDAILIGTYYSTRTDGVTTSTFSGWTFDVVGEPTLTFPDDTVQTTAWTGSVSSLVNGAHTVSLGTNGKLTLSTAGIVRSGTDTAQVGSSLTIATDSSEGTGEGTPNVVDVPFNGALYTAYPAGSTITFANGDVRTITSIAQGNVGLYLNLSYSGTATTSSPEFPIILKTANYAAATTAPEWQFGTDGTLTLPTGGTVSYTPATSTDWSGTPPTTMQEAIDRLAVAFKTLNNGTGA